MSENEPTPIVPAATKAELMKQIGDSLAERRKLRKLNITAISQALKIRASFIEALEKGQWDELPGEVYVRGFLVRYAQYLGMNGQDVLAPYIASQAKNPATSAPVERMRTSDPSKTNWIWLGVGILLIFGIIKFVSEDSPPEAPSSTPAPAPIASPAPEPVNQKSDAPQLAQHRLEIFTPGQLWLRVETADRKFEGIIPDGSSWTMKGNGEFKIHMGHTRQVALLFDGQQVTLNESEKKFSLPQ